MGIASKIDSLASAVAGLPSAVIAFSGGADSSLVLKAASMAGMRLLAVTGRSETTPVSDIESAIRTARALGAPHRIIETSELGIEEFASNPVDRCYHCKRHLFGLLSTLAHDEGYACVLEGSNADDAGDHRPGMRAARELGVRSPLLAAGLTKADVREISRSLGLDSWDRPSSPCLSSRIPYGMRITPEALGMIARAEDALHALGIRELRVRHHGDSARIEVRPEDMAAVIERSAQITSELRTIGYRYVSLDIEGLRSGSLNPRRGLA